MFPALVVALYLAFGAIFAMVSFLLLPLIEQGRLDRVYPQAYRERARYNAGRVLDVMELDVPGGRGRTIVVLAFCWPWVLFGRTR